MEDTDATLVDHRYFYTLGGVGKYAYGIAREAAGRQLRKFGMTKFGDILFWLALDDYIDNPSVTGFFIEQAVLSSIASHGLDIAENISGPINIVIFAGKFPQFDRHTHGAVLYCPLKFNYGSINGIIVQFYYSILSKMTILFAQSLISFS